MAHKESMGFGRLLATFAAATWLGACMPAETPSAGGSAGEGGAGKGGSSATGGKAGSGGSPHGEGSHGGSGGHGSGTSTGGQTAATGGRDGSGQGGGSGGKQGTADASTGSGATDTGASSGDAGPPPSAVPGYAVCGVCHGAEGAGSDKGPEIQHPVIDFSTWVIRNGRMHPGFMLPMPKYAPDQLTDAQLQGIFTYLAKFPKPTTGAALYKDYCQNCHGADGKGGVTMRTLAGKPVTKFLTDVRAGHHPGEFANRREYMPKWTAAELSDAEVRLIFMHVAGL